MLKATFIFTKKSTVVGPWLPTTVEEFNPGRANKSKQNIAPRPMQLIKFFQYENLKKIFSNKHLKFKKRSFRLTYIQKNSLDGTCSDQLMIHKKMRATFFELFH